MAMRNRIVGLLMSGVIVGASFLAAQSGGASVPRLIAFGGTVKDPGGDP